MKALRLLLHVKSIHIIRVKLRLSLIHIYAVIKVKKAEASVEDEIREFLDSVFKAMKLEVTIDIKVDEDNRNAVSYTHLFFTHQ